MTLHTSPSQTIICDSYGDSLVISKNGRPMGISEYRVTGGNRALLNEYHRKMDSAECIWAISRTFSIFASKETKIHKLSLL